MYFTGDTHYGSERTLQLSRRPFNNVTQMNVTMIMDCNSIVPEGELLYHVGDFGDYGVVKLINAKVILICGNYEWNDINKNFGGDFEAFRTHLLELGFHNVHPQGVELVYRQKGEHKTMWLDHYPSRSRNDMFNLFGHVHALRMVTENGLNVGVDCHHFRPVSLEDVDFFRKGIENVFDEDVFGAHHAKKSISLSYPQ